ncbi:MAG: ABC transporter ATP-binding protein [Candidatus Thermoplasmatota archaeon]|nr:ABC transporter ATP-binding protein [Candidatus Thermoplasmatota archaeon]
MITIEGLTKVYSRKDPPAVSDLTLQINDGEILGLVGLNGAGKTSTIRMISGIILPTAGTIKVDGFDIVKEKVKASANVGWVPEFPNFELNANPVTLMKYYAGFYDIDRSNEEEQILSLLDEVGLKPYTDRKLRNYSQGMKKRFAIAETLLGDPRNFLFDETLNGLDPEGVVFVRNLILSLKKRGKAVMLSSHILSEVENIADKVAIISHGKLLKVLTRDELRNLGKVVVRISVDNPDEKLKSILSDFGSVMVSGSDVTISELSIDVKRVPEIASRIVASGYSLRKFETSGESLEEYFFSIIGEKA